MGFRSYIFQDKQANIGNPTKGKYVVVLFRIAQYIVKRQFTKIVFFWYLLFYRVVVEYFMCVELSWNTRVGHSFSIWHGSGVVIHPDTIIGTHCKIRQCTTIGVKDAILNNASIAPEIGNHVDIGCNTVIIGCLQIGDNVAIGAGSVVVKSVSSNTIVAGNPAKFIRDLAPLTS